jgi:ketosteroid isomerase-like protein
MDSEKNIKIVKDLFAAFEKGDIPSAIQLFSSDVYFQSPVTRLQSHQISWAKPRKGRKEVGEFFMELNENAQVEKMEPIVFIAENEYVAVEGKNKGFIRKTGKNYEHDWVMIFTIKDGLIERCRHFYDTADITEAF